MLKQLTVAAIGAGVLLGAAPGRRLDDGYQLTFKVTSDAAQSTDPVLVTLKVAGDKIRVEMDIASMMGRGGGGGGGGMGGEMAVGAYMLVQPAGKIGIILPALGMGVLADASSLGGRGRGAAPATPAGDLTVSVEDLGAGETIAGHPTHKFRTHEKCTLTTNAMGQSTTAKHDDTSDLWMASDLGDAEQGFKKFWESFGAIGARAGCGRAQVAAALGAKMPKGMPVKIVSTQNTDTGKSVSTIEATEIKKTSFDASDFEVPAGMQLMDMGGRGGRGGRSSSSTR
jgi:hypothetical protein